MLNENTIEIINQNYIIEIDTPQYNILAESTLNIDYNYAAKKPQINSVELIGNKSAEDFGLATLADMKNKEDVSNKVTALNENSTDIDYPSAKCVREQLITKANVDFSNLSEIAQAKFDEKADINLANLSETAQSKFDGKANIDLTNLSEQAEKHFLNKMEITNCILEIPQSIKLEVKDKTLLLKGGSELIIPNGFEADGTTPKFNYIIVPSDIELYVGTLPTNTEKLVLITNSTADTGFVLNKTLCASGTTTPQSGFYAWYDTASNLVKYSANANGNWVSGLSLPVGVFQRTTDNNILINQVFNGLGYIGSHIWMNKGVKILVANGMNDDGTIKNEEIIISNVLVSKNSASGTRSDLIPFLRKNPISNQLQIYTIIKTNFLGELDYVPETGSSFQWYFNTSEMKWYMHEAGATEWVSTPYYNISPPITVANNVITSFKPYKTFRAVDYNDFATTPRIVETYKNGTSWYRVYSDGWIEQGGVFAAGTNSYQTATLLKAFSNTDYGIFLNIRHGANIGTNSEWNASAAIPATTSTFTYYRCGVLQSWYACGY